MAQVFQPRTVAGVTFVALAILSVTHAKADDRDICLKASGDDETISACTRAINSGRYSGSELAVLFERRCKAWSVKGESDSAIQDCTQAIQLRPNDAAFLFLSRGNVYARKGDYDRAITDYDQAIRLKTFPVAFNNRGNAYLGKGQYDRAIQDYNQAIRLYPKFADGYTGRGIANFLSGVFNAAASDFLQANNLEPDAYAMLWRFLARGRMGQNGAMELSAAAAQLKAKEWPSPVIEFYLNQRSLEAMRAAASKPEEQCEAAFYVGEWHLLRGNKSEAQTELQKATDGCPKDSIEYIGAVAELKRLKP